MAIWKYSTAIIQKTVSLLSLQSYFHCCKIRLACVAGSLISSDKSEKHELFRHTKKMGLKSWT